MLELVLMPQPWEVERRNIDLPDLVAGGGRSVGIRMDERVAEVSAFGIRMPLNDDDAMTHANPARWRRWSVATEWRGMAKSF